MALKPIEKKIENMKLKKPKTEILLLAGRRKLKEVQLTQNPEKPPFKKRKEYLLNI